jgi:hypothetical protein
MIFSFDVDRRQNLAFRKKTDMICASTISIIQNDAKHNDKNKLNRGAV